MPNDLYSSYGAQAQAQPQAQNPREQCMNIMKQQGIQIPQGMENNPNAILNHLMQSGRIPQGRFNMAQQMLSKLIRR